MQRRLYILCLSLNLRGMISISLLKQFPNNFFLVSLRFVINAWVQQISQLFVFFFQLYDDFFKVIIFFEKWFTVMLQFTYQRMGVVQLLIHTANHLFQRLVTTELIVIESSQILKLSAFVFHFFHHAVFQIIQSHFEMLNIFFSLFEPSVSFRQLFSKLNVNKMLVI